MANLSTIIDSYKGVTVYPVLSLSFKKKLSLLFRKCHTLYEVLSEVNKDGLLIVYYRLSTYKILNNERVYLSSYIGCTIYYEEV